MASLLTGARRYGKSMGMVVLAGLAAGLSGARTVEPASVNARRDWRHADRLDVNLGRWFYKRKGKRTAAQVQRAARKKRNRARNK